MAIDLLFILILSIWMFRITTGDRGYDFIGCMGGSLILYLIVKAPVLAIFVGGFSWPLVASPAAHLASGSIAFVCVCLFYLRATLIRARWVEIE